VTVWDIQARKPIRKLDMGFTAIDKNNDVLSCAFSRDGELLAVSDFAGRVQVWEIATGELVATPVGDTGRAWALAFSPQEDLLAQGGSEATVQLWMVNRRGRAARPVAVLRGHTREVSCLAFSPDGNLLASGGRGGAAMLWNLKRNIEGNILTNSFMSHVTCRALISPDSKALAAMTGERSVGVWNLSTGELLASLNGQAFALAVSTNAETVVTLATNLSLQTWSVTSGELRHAVALSDLAGVSRDRTATNGIFCATLSPDKKTLVTGQQNGTIIRWNALTGARLATLHHHTRAVRAMTFSPDGLRLLTCAADHTSKLLNLETQQELVSLEHPLNYVFTAAFSPDGRTLVTGSIDATLWDAVTGKEIAALRAHKEGVFWVAFSPSGKTLATASDDRTVKLWNLATLREVATIQHEKPVLYAGFTPDGRTLITGTLAGPYFLWRGSDLSTGQSGSR
jgi:WD40 repeat protein